MQQGLNSTKSSDKYIECLKNSVHTEDGWAVTHQIPSPAALTLPHCPAMPACEPNGLCIVRENYETEVQQDEWRMLEEGHCQGTQKCLPPLQLNVRVGYEVFRKASAPTPFPPFGAHVNFNYFSRW